MLLFPVPEFARNAMRNAANSTLVPGDEQRCVFWGLLTGDPAQNFKVVYRESSLTSSTVYSAEVPFVRRLVANSLLLFFLGMFIAPAFMVATTSSPLPACCRRGGAHHCAMMAAMLMSEEGNSFRSVNPCPMQQAGQLGSTVAIGLPVSPSTYIEVFPEALGFRAVSRLEFTVALAGHPRGPPPPLG